MGKHKEKSKKHKKSKKRKKDRRSSSSSSDEWVEKTQPVKEQLEENAMNTSCTRDDWMNLPSSFHTTSNIAQRTIREENKRLEKEKNQYNPKENIRELNPYWKNGGDGLPSFKKPSDDNFEYKQKKTSTFSNWRKKTDDENKKNQDIIVTNLSSSSTDIKSESGSAHNKTTNKELNSLAAKLIKAELMGNTELITELKYKLEEARKMSISSKDEDDKNVLLTSTDNQGHSRPLKMKSEVGESSGIKTKKQKVETHSEGQRIRYFADDDKYSLKEMFQNEKYESIDDQNRQFVKMASKVKTDLDDFFVDEIRMKSSDEKLDKKDISKAIAKHQSITKSLENCKFCLQSDVMSKHLMVTMGETIYLSLPPFEPITEGHCFLVPLKHTSCATQLDENEWSEILNFRKALCKMYNSLNKDVIFFESASYLYKHPHMILECVPMSKEECDLAPMYFKKAIDESEIEWTSNKKLVSLANRDVRKAIPKGLPYFSISFGMTEGYAHVIEDEKLFPQNFAQEIIGGILDLHHSKWRKPKRQRFEEQSERVKHFAKIWKEFDCTK